MKIGILPESDNNNGWLEVLPPLPQSCVAQGKIKADYTVIGGGFTGLAAARRLAELMPDKQVVLVEAGRIGNNAAGRCSGFAIDQAHNIRAKDFAGNLQTEFNQIAINRAGQDYLCQQVTDHAIDCDWHDYGKIHAAATAKGVGQLQAYASNLDLLGADYSWLNRQQMQDTTGTGFYKQGLHTPGTILMQPAQLVIGLAMSMPDNVVVFEDSPIKSIVENKGWTLGLEDAEIESTEVVLANNGFAGQFGYYQKNLIPIVTWGSLTRPLKEDELKALGGEDSWGIIPANPFGTSVRRTIDGRILIRNIYSYSSGINPTEKDRLWAKHQHLKSLRNRFPMLPDLEFDYTWGGALCLSQNGEPVFGKLAKGMFGAFCLNGVGIARGTAYGKLLAEYMAGESNELINIMLASGKPDALPPRPFLDWGVRLNFAKRRFDAGLEL